MLLPGSAASLEPTGDEFAPAGRLLAVQVFAIASMASVGLTYTLREILGPLRNVRGVVLALLATFLAVGPLQNARLLEPLGYFDIQLGYVLGLGTKIGLLRGSAVWPQFG